MGAVSGSEYVRNDIGRKRAGLRGQGLQVGRLAGLGGNRVVSGPRPAEGASYLLVKVALGQSAAHLPEAISLQAVAFRQTAQVSSGLTQVASHEKPDDLSPQLDSLSQAFLQLLSPQAESPSPSISTSTSRERTIVDHLSFGTV